MRWFLLAVLVPCVLASPQYVKSRYSGGVKGGYSGPSVPSSDSLRFFNNTQPGYGGYSPAQNHSAPVDYEKGVCYIEVPTATIAKDPAHVPAGNGSRADLSRIRTCCRGYIRNIHNFRICDPVCTQECVNALCAAPDTCTCFPDHVKNLAGFCVPTCPIGCQNGYCAGGECICKDGYKLDSESKFCVPLCRDNCGGIGNCTTPNTCECRTGYTSSPEGSCKPRCDRCGNFGECVAPNDCRCKSGYAKNPQGDCAPQCAGDCQPNGRCVAPGVCDYPVTTTTTIRPAVPYGHGGPGLPVNPSAPTTRAPHYPGSDPHQQYPGQQSGYPDSQQPGYPRHQQSGYPSQQQPAYGQQQPGYPGGQQSQSQYPDSQHSQSGHPSYYPGSQQSNPGNPPPQSPDHQGYYPGSQPSGYPGQRPAWQPIYYNPGQQQPPPQSGSQHGYPQRPGYPDSQEPSSHPGSSHGREPYYPGSQYYPGGQPGHSQYPQQQVYYPVFNQTQYSSYGQQQAQSQYPGSQVGNVETLCSRPCINGECTGQDKCTCKEGYVIDETDPTATRCKPNCPGGCPNGVCSSPYFCICNLGYYKDHSVKGRANCVKRMKRSAEAPLNVAELLVFEIPDEDNDIEL